MKRLIKPVFLLLFLSMLVTGCTRYTANRAADFRDMFTFGVGITRENPETVISPSLGFHVQVTELIQVGAIHFSGNSADWDGRGFRAGPETKSKVSIIAPVYRNVNQNYERGRQNYFKEPTSLWRQRMFSDDLSNSTYGWPAKNLVYQDIRPRDSESSNISDLYFDRGWHHWANINAELALADPIFHWGFRVKLGFDWSEFSDFILGIFTLDILKGDDMTREEFKEYRNRRKN